MSILVHFCACGHPEGHHLIRADTPTDRLFLYDTGHGGTGARKSCPCCAIHGTARDISPEPTVVETWKLFGHEPEPLYPPGVEWNTGTSHRQKLCGCAACQARYAELSTAA